MTNPQFLETIRAEDGTPFHLDYHQRRLEATLHANRIDAEYDLTSLLSPPKEGLYRCRVIYDGDKLEATYHPYLPRRFKSLQAVVDDTIEYPFKYADRSALDALFEKRGESDDVIIIKRGMLTDTTIANIALFDGSRWVTPSNPLLPGTTRQRLLDERKIEAEDIPFEKLHRYRKVAIMNAMVGFVEVENGIIFPK